jgi:hypothetical protein
VTRPSHFHLTHPSLDLCVDVTVHERDGRYMATADLAEDSRDVGVGDTPQEAARADRPLDSGQIHAHREQITDSDNGKDFDCNDAICAKQVSVALRVPVRC